MSVVRDNAEPLAIVFEDDGLTPNNIRPFLVYQAAVKLDPKQPEATIEDLFEANGWGGPGATASTIICIITRRCTRCSASRAAAPASASAATTARS